MEYGRTIAYGGLTALNPALVINHSMTLTGLAANALYNFRVRSRDAGGRLSISANFTFTTAAAPPAPDTTPPTISAVASSEISASAATITWLTNENSNSQVEFGQTPAYGLTTPLDAAGATNHRVRLTDLAPFARYHYRVKSRDAAGNLAVSGNFTFITSFGFFNFFNTVDPGAGGSAPVSWTNIVKAISIGTGPEKPAGCDGCGSTAVSQQRITSGNGYLEVVANEANQNGRIGLMLGGKPVSGANIDYAIGLCNGARVSIRERGRYRTQTTCRTGDVFRVAVEDGVVKYYKNGAVIYQSRVAYAYPLVAAVALFNPNASVPNAVIATAGRAK